MEEHLEQEDKKSVKSKGIDEKSIQYRKNARFTISWSIDKHSRVSTYLINWQTQSGV